MRGKTGAVYRSAGRHDRVDHLDPTAVRLALLVRVTHRVLIRVLAAKPLCLCPRHAAPKVMPRPQVAVQLQTRGRNPAAVLVLASRGPSRLGTTRGALQRPGLVPPALPIRRAHVVGHGRAVHLHLRKQAAHGWRAVGRGRRARAPWCRRRPGAGAPPTRRPSAGSLGTAPRARRRGKAAVARGAGGPPPAPAGVEAQ